VADKLKLVKNVKRPKLLPKGKDVHVNRNVKNAFARAIQRCVTQDWNKVIIIGCGKENGSWHHTPMDDVTVIGMLEKTKKFILTDNE